jgi:hypothetical protein
MIDQPLVNNIPEDEGCLQGDLNGYHCPSCGVTSNYREMIRERDATIESLRAQVESKELVLVPRIPTPDMRYAFHLSMELYEDCESDLGMPDDQWVAMIEAFKPPELLESEK